MPAGRGYVGSQEGYVYLTFIYCKFRGCFFLRILFKHHLFQPIEAKTEVVEFSKPKEPQPFGTNISKGDSKGTKLFLEGETLFRDH